jgi:hypothetical protein
MGGNNSSLSFYTDEITRTNLWSSWLAEAVLRAGVSPGMLHGLVEAIAPTDIFVADLPNGLVYIQWRSNPILEALRKTERLFKYRCKNIS